MIVLSPGLAPVPGRHNEEMLHQDRRRAESFGADAEQYDRARPGYPASLVDDLLDDRSGCAVVDVGCGTGITSRLFAGRGCRVLGVEADPRMAAVARRSGVEVEDGTFESWQDAGRRFDLVVSGQAWHWIEPSAGSAKAAALLSEGGRVGVFWNHGVQEPEAQEELQVVYRRLAPGIDEDSILLGSPVARRIQAAAAGFGSSGRFSVPEVRTYPWHKTYSRDEWLDLLPTHSDHRTLPGERLAALLEGVGAVIDGLGGTLDVRYTTWLVTAEVA
jgi:SAM-dependent methyltransferase